MDATPQPHSATQQRNLASSVEHAPCAKTARFSAWNEGNLIPRADVAPPRKGSILGDGRAHLAASCPARGQVGAVPMRGPANLAPPAPPAKRSEPIASQILHLGPPTSEAKIGPAGTSGTGRRLQIGYRRLMLRWISLTSAWLGAAKATFHRRFSLSRARVRRGPICCRGVRSRVATEACEKGRRRLRLHHRWGRARIRQASCAYQRVSSWAPRPHAAVWLPSLGCPLGRSLPRLPMGWRGLARGLCTSPPMVVRPGSTQLSGFEVRFLVSGPRSRGRPSCCGDSASR